MDNGRQLAVIAVAGALAQADAANYPQRTLRIVMPFPPQQFSAFIKAEQA